MSPPSVIMLYFAQLYYYNILIGTPGARKDNKRQ